MKVKFQIHPDIAVKVRERTPKGHVLLFQAEETTEQDTRKRAINLTGLDRRDIVIIRGHYGNTLERGAKRVEWFKDGYMVFVPDDGTGQPKKRREVTNKKTHRSEPAQYQKGSCPECGRQGLVVQTGLCGVCTWDDLDMVEGAW